MTRNTPRRLDVVLVEQSLERSKRCPQMASVLKANLPTRAGHASV
jgi:hypothetical protein